MPLLEPRVSFPNTGSSFSCSSFPPWSSSRSRSQPCPRCAAGHFRWTREASFLFKRFARAALRLSAYAVGQLNGVFALWAGLLDVALGLSAPFAAHYLTPTRTRRQRRLLVIWMVVGLLDFAVAIPLASIVRTGDPASMSAMAMLPLCMIPTFFVPLAVMAYIILGTHVWRQRRST